MKSIYLDNGATTKVDPQVIKAMLPFYSTTYGNASSIHHFGVKAKESLEAAREVIAKSLNADSKEVIFTSGGTESDNYAIKGIAYFLKEKGNHIITSKIEHPAVLNTCAELEKEGFSITYLGVDKDAQINLAELEKAITDKTILITIMHANNEVGTILPIEQIGEIAKKHKILFHTDAVQSFTKVSLDVKKINVDLISLSAHKIHGPKGIGALYIKRGTRLKKMFVGGHHEFDKRAGTENVSGAVGFAKAVEIAQKENKKNLKKMIQLRDYMIKSILTKISKTKLNGSKKDRLPNNVNIGFEFIEGESLLLHLDLKGICASTGSACSSASLEPSHVLIAMGIPHEKAHGTIRFTISKFTTKQEIDYTIKQLIGIVDNLRKLSPLTNSKKKYSDIVDVHHHC